MSFSPNAAAAFPLKATAFSAAVPALAKIMFSDSSNTALLIAADADHPRTFGSLFVQPVNSYSSGRLMLYRFDGTSYFGIDDIAITGVSLSATSAFSRLGFTQWTPTAPLVLPEGSSLLIATSVAQTSGALIAHAQLGKVF